MKFRPNIQYIISLMSQFGGNLDISHLEATKWIFHYLKGIIEYSLILSCCQGIEEFDLVG